MLIPVLIVHAPTDGDTVASKSRIQKSSFPLMMKITMTMTRIMKRKGNDTKGKNTKSVNTRIHVLVMMKTRQNRSMERRQKEIKQKTPEK